MITVNVSSSSPTFRSFHFSHSASPTLPYADEEAEILAEMNEDEEAEEEDEASVAS